MSLLHILIIILILSIVLLIVVYAFFIKTLKENKVNPEKIKQKRPKSKAIRTDYPQKDNYNGYTNIQTNLSSRERLVEKQKEQANSYQPQEFEKGDYSVILYDPGPNKILVIKEIRTVTNLGLKEAKNIADNANSTIISNISQVSAEEIKATFTNIGAKAKIVESSGQLIVMGEYTVILDKPGESIIDTINEIRLLTGTELREARDMVHELPSIICYSVDREFAENVKTKLEEIGASVTVVPNNEVRKYLKFESK